MQRECGQGKQKVMQCNANAGKAQSFLDHIRLGIEEAAADPEAMLLFSGGQTRREAGPRSEGLSYWVRVCACACVHCVCGQQLCVLEFCVAQGAHAAYVSAQCHPLSSSVERRGGWCWLVAGQIDAAHDRIALASKTS